MQHLHNGHKKDVIHKKVYNKQMKVKSETSINPNGKWIKRKLMAQKDLLAFEVLSQSDANST